MSAICKPNILINDFHNIDIYKNKTMVDVTLINSSGEETYKINIDLEERPEKYWTVDKVFWRWFISVEYELKKNSLGDTENLKLWLRDIKPRVSDAKVKNYLRFKINNCDEIIDWKTDKNKWETKIKNQDKILFNVAPPDKDFFKRHRTFSDKYMRYKFRYF